MFGDWLGKAKCRQFCDKSLKISIGITTPLMVWNTLLVVTSCASPVMVVLSGSMEPTFHRGDLLLVTNYQDDPVTVGDIVVFKLEIVETPVVHRVVMVRKYEDGAIELLTKGDNNSVDDRALYSPGNDWLTRDSVIGQVNGVLPYMGMAAIYTNDHPVITFCLMLLLGMFSYMEEEL